MAVIPLFALAACSGDGPSDAVSDAAAITAAPSDPTSTAATTVATIDAPDGSDTSAAPTSVPTDGSSADGVEVLAAAVVPAAHVPLAASVDVELDRPAQIGLTARSGDHVVETLFTATPSTEPSVPLVGLRSDRTYEITVAAMIDGGTTELSLPAPLSFTTPPLPDWMPAHTVTSDPSRVAPGITIIESSPTITADPANQDDGTSETGDSTTEEPGDDTVATYPTSVAIGYDAEGEIVWYYTNQGLGGIEQTDRGTFIAHYGPFGIREFDMLGNVVGHWRPEVAVSNGTRNPGVLPDGNAGDAMPITIAPDWIELRTFHHEARTMPNGNLLALSTTLHDLTPEQREAICPGDPIEFRAISDVVVEFTPEGDALRTWDLFDVVDIVGVPGSDMCATDGGLFATQEKRDWTHANAVVYDPGRDAIIVSSRHTDQLIALDHLDDLGPQRQLRWIIGTGATMPLDGDPTYHQHAVELLDDGAIIIYDNGNGRPGTEVDDPDHPTYSRAVVFEVDDDDPDPSTWSVHQRWEHIADDEDGSPVFTSFIGDADILANGNVLITHGGIGPFPPDPDFPLRALIIEVVPEGSQGGDIVWRLETDPAQSHTVYRSEKVESFYVGDWVTRP